jgi:predicted DNA-binding transcriptional regulator AlpA
MPRHEMGRGTRQVPQLSPTVQPQADARIVDQRRAAIESPNTSTPSWLVDDREAARLHGISRSSWWTLHASGRCPAPVKLGRRTLWRRAELAAWIRCGAPSRERWNAMQERGS